MTSYTDILKATREMVSKYMSGYDPSHDMHHVDRVTRTGKHRHFYVDYILTHLLRNKLLTSQRTTRKITMPLTLIFNWSSWLLSAMTLAIENTIKEKKRVVSSFKLF